MSRKSLSHIRRFSTASIAILALALAGQAAFLSLHFHGSWLKTDDFLNFGIARDMGLTWNYLLRGVFGHFAPGHRLMSWLLIEQFGISWAAAFVIISLFSMVTTLLIFGIYREFTLNIANSPSYSSKQTILPLVLCLSAFSALYTPSLAWYSAGAHTFPSIAFSCGAFLFAMRFERKNSYGDLLGYTICLIGALCFYSKAILVPIGAALLVLESRSSSNSVRGTLWQTRALHTVSVIVLTGYFVNLALGDYRPGRLPVSATVWLAWSKELALNGPFPAFFGWGFNDDPSYRMASVVATSVWIGALGLGLWLRRWFAVLFFVCTYVLGLLLTAYGRAGEFGPSVAGEYRYSVELGSYGAIYLMLLGRHLDFPRWTGPVAISLSFLVAGCAANSATHNTRSLYDPRVKVYFDALTRSLSELTENSLILHETATPFHILDSVFDPYSRSSYIAKLIDPKIIVHTDPAAVDAKIIDADGNIVPSKQIDELKAPSRICYSLTLPVRSLTARPTHPRYLAYSASPPSAFVLLQPSNRIISLENKANPTVVDLGHAEFSVLQIRLPDRPKSCIEGLHLFTQHNDTKNGSIGPPASTS